MSRIARPPLQTPNLLLVLQTLTRLAPALLLCLALAPACASDEQGNAEACVEGRQLSCSCSDGKMGSQVCQSGAFGACQCQSDLLDMSGDMADDNNPADLSTMDASGDDLGRANADMAAQQGRALDLLERLAGLWVGPANQTPLGNFPLMNFDFRPADSHQLFGRVDLDDQNSLRMAFFLETINGEDRLVFRNGGLFAGLERDTKTTLESYDEASDTWHFCHPERGCEYVDATITFSSETQMRMDVKVRENQHLLWEAQRKETRELPQPFPADEMPIGQGDAPFPPMPGALLEVTWSPAVDRDTRVWVIFSTTNCGFTGRNCQSSRSISATLESGDTSANLRLDQIHPGDYKLNVILDRNANFETRPFPDSGDSILFPVDKPVTVADTEISDLGSVSANQNVP